MDRSELLRLARAGAAARLAEMDQERDAILRQFPDLRGNRRTTADSIDQNSADRPRRKRSTMSAAQRKAVSDRMRRYWADRRGKTGGEGSANGATKKTARKGRTKSARSKGARKMSAAARKRISDAQKARWAAKRKAA